MSLYICPNPEIIQNQECILETLIKKAEDTEPTFPDECIKNTSTYGIILTHWKRIGNWQNDLCKTKAVRKIYVKQVEMEEEWSGWEPVPLGGDLEKKRNYTMETFPGEWAV